MDLFINPDPRYDEFNDLDVQYDAESYAVLRANGIDAMLSKHIAHLFIRDALVTFDMGMYSSRLKKRMARLSRPANTVNAAFSNSVSITSIVRSSTRHASTGPPKVGGFHRTLCQLEDWMFYASAPAHAATSKCSEDCVSSLEA